MLEENAKNSKDNTNKSKNNKYTDWIMEIANILNSKLILDYENTILKLTILEREQNEQIQLAKKTKLDSKYLEIQKKYLSEIANLKKEYNEKKESTANKIKELSKTTANLKTETIAVSRSYDGIIQIVNVYEHKCIEYEKKLKYVQDFLHQLTTIVESKTPMLLDNENQTEEN